MAASVIGLTGGIGSGKSAVAEEFARLGICVVDADAIAHALTAPGGTAMPLLQQAFGTEVVRADGALDREVMRARVFSDPVARERLNTLLHPLIAEEALRELAAAAILSCSFLLIQALIAIAPPTMSAMVSTTPPMVRIWRLRSRRACAARISAASRSINSGSRPGRSPSPALSALRTRSPAMARSRKTSLRKLPTSPGIILYGSSSMRLATDHSV